MLRIVMAKEIEIKIPDIGGATDVDVIEILVQVGDKIQKDTALITLESDKASMEIPSPREGIIKNISVNVGDKVSEGDLILSVESEEDEASASPMPESKEFESKQSNAQAEPQKEQKVTEQVQTIEVAIPDIGVSTDVDVIDVLVQAGSQIEKEQALVTLEGDKATMDIPSPYAGRVKEVKIKLGDKVSQGTPVLIMETTHAVTLADKKQEEPNVTTTASVEQSMTTAPETPKVITQTDTSIEYPELLSAGPAVRRMARELGVNLSQVKGSGRKTRITKEDVQSYVKARLSEKAGVGNFGLTPAPIIDFSRFGDIEKKSLNKIKKLTGVNVHRAWVTIPHVTQFDEADITELEAFRKAESAHAADLGYKLTILAFVCSIVSKALHEYPQFNASLDASGDNLIYKKYCNIGIAVETPNGLVVPVIKNVDQLTVAEIAVEMARLSNKARDKGLSPAEMSGGCFTISSLGGIGGTAFTPIVNSPEVAILGLSRSVIRPVYDGNEFKPRLMLPLSLSYDHRVIDGAEAARFTRFIGESLSDIRKILL